MKKLILLLFVLLCCTSLFAQSAGPMFFYVVTAVDANGFESGFSNQQTAVFLQGQKTATLAWTAGTGGSAAVGYNVYRAKVSGGPYTKINSSLITGVTVTDTFLVPAVPILAAPTVN